MATDGAAPILELADVAAGYGAMTILNGTTFRVRRGTIKHESQAQLDCGSGCCHN